MEIVLAWIIFAVVVGLVGTDRTIGFGGAFLISLLLSPLVGFIIVLCYPSRAHQRRSLEQQQMQTQILQSMATTQSSSAGVHQGSVADEILKLKSLHEAGALTEEEFAMQKQKLLRVR